MTQPVKIILLHETVLQSIVKDFFTFLTTFVLIGLGVVIGSTVMQVFGAIAAVFLMFSKVMRSIKDFPILTPQKAADYLKANFGVVAK